MGVLDMFARVSRGRGISIESLQVSTERDGNMDEIETVWGYHGRGNEHGSVETGEVDKVARVVEVLASRSGDGNGKDRNTEEEEDRQHAVVRAEERPHRMAVCWCLCYYNALGAIINIGTCIEIIVKGQSRLGLISAFAFVEARRAVQQFWV